MLREHFPDWRYGPPRPQTRLLKLRRYLGFAFPMSFGRSILKRME